MKRHDGVQGMRTEATPATRVAQALPNGTAEVRRTMNRERHLSLACPRCGNVSANPTFRGEDGLCKRTKACTRRVMENEQEERRGLR